MTQSVEARARQILAGVPDPHTGRDLVASGALRGVGVSGADVTLDGTRSGAAAADPLVQGALRAYAAIPSLADTWTRAPRQVLARLHTLAGADLVEDRERLGKPTAGAERLDILAAVLDGTHAPAAVVAAIVHGEVLSLDAFAPVSGIVARVAVRLTLIERGLDPKSLVVVEAGFRGDDHDAALAAYRTGTKDGIAAWLRHACEAVVTGATETTAICEAMVRG